MVYLKHKLTILDKDKVVFETSNTQDLYLYPLSLKDYIDNLYLSKPIKIDIIKIDNSVDYDKYFNNSYFSNLLCAEIHIDNIDNLSKIKDIIMSLSKKNTKISLNIKNIISLPLSFLKEVSNYITYFKVYWAYNDIIIFNEKVKTINKYKNSDAFIHVKSYLKLEEIDNYEKYILNFKELGVDVYQLSKSLLLPNEKNVIIDKKYEEVIRSLEDKYDMFISVKNLRELYYPRFEIDSRNTRNCYACKLKPYLYGDTILPCKVDDKINNISKWGVKEVKEDSFKSCGIECDDCASLFENDILDEVNKIIKDKDKLLVKMKRG